MASFTIRNIPDEVLAQVRELSVLERRSMNNEILYILENGIQAQKMLLEQNKGNVVSEDERLRIWRTLSGQWKDKRSTEEIVEDIYSSRSFGRELNLWFSLIQIFA